MYFYIQPELKAFLINELAISERSSKIENEKTHIWNATEKISSKYNEEYFKINFFESYQDMVQLRGFFHIRVAIHDWLNEISPVMEEVKLSLASLVSAIKKGRNRSFSYQVLRDIGYS